MKKITKEELNAIKYVFQIINNKVPDLNYGGCGFFAKEAFKLFKKLGYNPEIIFLSSKDEISYHDTKEAIKIAKTNKNNNGLKPFIPSHVCVKVGDYYIDSGGYVKEKDKRIALQAWPYRELGVFPLDDLNFLLKSPTLWNASYERQHNSVLRKKFKEIGDFLPKYAN